jgi:T4 bacteriophage base plate protein
MAEEIFRQSRKPIKQSDFEVPVDPEEVMARAQQLIAAKEAAANTNEPKIDPDNPLQFEGNIPPALQRAMQQNRETNGETTAPRKQHGPQPSAPKGPRLAYTNNPKLNELIDGLKPSAQYEEVTLPSRSRFYEEDSGIAPKDGVIHIRTMTGEEEHILATPRFLKKGQAINMIFNNCVQENIQPDKLLTIDRTYLLIYLRGISYGPDYEVEVKCPSCAARFSTTIDLDAMTLSFCSDEFGPENLHDALPTTGYKFSYRLSTVRDEQAIADYRDRRIKEFGDQAADNTWTYRAATLIDQIEGLDTHQELQTLISRLPINDVTYIRNILNATPFGVDTKVGIICPMCAEDFEIDLPMEASFFFPKPKKGKKIRV